MAAHLFPVIGSWLERQSTRFPETAALVFEDRACTYFELNERSRRLAAGLRSRGLLPGDRLAHLGPNQPAALEALFAATRLGAVFMPMSPRLAALEIAYLIQEGAPRMVLCSDESRGLLEEAVVAARTGPGGRSSPLVLPSGGTAQGTAEYEALLRTAPDGPGIAETAVLPDDLALLLFTSGTTGHPKGVMLTQANVVWGVLNLQVMGLRPDDIHLAFAPLSRSGGLLVVMNVLFTGATVVLLPRFDPKEILELIPRYGVTNVFGGPDTYRKLIESPGFDQAELASVRLLVSGGAPMSADLIRAYFERGLLMTQGYGLTETAPLALYLESQYAKQRIGSAGRPPFFTEVRLVDTRLRDVAPGEVGEIVVRGPNVMKGYWRRPEATEAVMAGEWLTTGDAARVDEDGFYYLVDRLKDVYSVGDDNIFPAEIEQALVAHPAVSEAAVIGVPDDDTGEAGAAFVVLSRAGPSPTLGELRSFLAGRLAAHKVPKHVSVVDDLPRTPTGKVAKAALRRRFAE